MYRQNLRHTLQLNTPMYLGFLGIWAIGWIYQLQYSQMALSIWINQMHTPLLDLVMVCLTYAGDGLLLLVAGILFIIYRKKNWWMIVLCLALPSLVTQLLKHQVFPDHYRPAIVMEGITGLHWLESIDINKYNSFPSGHTTAAFSLYTLTGLLIPQKKWGWVWPVIAALVGISRIYLLQHFWVDVLAGAAIGITLTTLLYALHPVQHHSYEIR
ncbi:MAG: phosphatase PAP2 family protein [Bacteroidia bacterium]|nr:phosphatase PAP2 family protein [Bacteroidia bacterium]